MVKRNLSWQVFPETQALLRGCCGVAKAAVGEEERQESAAVWGMGDVQDKPLAWQPYQHIIHLSSASSCIKRERWSRDVIQGHGKSSQRNLEGLWGWLGLSSWHTADITTKSVVIASKELQDTLEPSSRPGLPLTEVRSLLPTCDITQGDTIAPDRAFYKIFFSFRHKHLFKY